VLVKQGETKEALEKYDEALQCAPKWKEFKEARDAAKRKIQIRFPKAARRDRPLRVRLRSDRRGAAFGHPRAGYVGIHYVSPVSFRGRGAPMRSL